jgi:nitroimidazol reductase NimA-like FMN-containing flavoprotein (pyridoxamine 5'-phosphate oxidase superfamily)
MATYPDLEAIARDVIHANKYMTLGTADRDGQPWATPVYYSPIGYHTFYWVSSPEARHSRNVADRPDISIVVFDSTVPIGGAQAVYMAARAEEVPQDELADRCAEVFDPRFPGIRRFEPAELQPPEQLRLYRATVLEHSVLIRGRDLVYGRGVDHRMTVEL